VKDLPDTFYKILTHDLRPPLQGGDPLPIDKLPYETEAVVLDAGPASCAPGWHSVGDLATGFRIAGLWRTGRPARVFEVEPSDDVVERNEKFRSSKLTFARELDLEGIEKGVHDLSKPFGRYRRGMVSEQMAWYVALGRPEHDPERVEAGLQKALKARGLRWDLKRYGAARAARDAWAAWDARDAWDAWAARAARDAWDARAAWDARDARDAWDAWAARAARDARAAWDAWAARAAWDAWAARDAWDARAAWDALTVTYAAKQGWGDHKPSLLTAGLRDAYHCGLGIAIPTGPNELGWAMDEHGQMD
jgi:hypothetical protein